MDIKLVAASGLGRGEAIPIQGKVFIGGDEHCRVRPPVPGLSGIHTLIEIRHGSVFVRDCDTTLGTTINDALIHSKECEAFDGDRIALGDCLWTIRVRPREDHEVPTFEHVPAGWPAVSAGSADGSTDEFPALAAPVPRRTSAENAFTYESPTGTVLIVTPTAADLNDETTVAPLRADLQRLFDDGGVPAKQVVDLGNVQYMSSRAVGVILAHFQRLDRDGGSLRVCRVGSQVAPVLHQMRLDRMIDVYETLAEATDTPWE